MRLYEVIMSSRLSLQSAVCLGGGGADADLFGYTSRPSLRHGVPDVKYLQNLVFLKHPAMENGASDH